MSQMGEDNGYNNIVVKRSKVEWPKGCKQDSWTRILLLAHKALLVVNSYFKYATITYERDGFAQCLEEGTTFTRLPLT